VTATPAGAIDPIVVASASLMAASTRLFRRALDGADEAALRWRPFPGANPMHWIAAHTTTVRANLLGLLGRPYPLEWAKLFARGGTNEDEAAWPPLATIVEQWDAIAARLKERMPELTADEIAAKVQVPSFDGTVRGTIQLISFHDAYHIGQLAYLRRKPGLDRLVG
jgi:hypothetical protein